MWYSVVQVETEKNARNNKSEKNISAHFLSFTSDNDITMAGGKRLVMHFEVHGHSVSSRAGLRDIV